MECLESSRSRPQMAMRNVKRRKPIKVLVSATKYIYPRRPQRNRFTRASPLCRSGITKKRFGDKNVARMPWAFRNDRKTRKRRRRIAANVGAGWDEIRRELFKRDVSLTDVLSRTGSSSSSQAEPNMSSWSCQSQTSPTSTSVPQPDNRKERSSDLTVDRSQSRGEDGEALDDDPFEIISKKIRNFFDGVKLFFEICKPPSAQGSSSECQRV